MGAFQPTEDGVKSALIHDKIIEFIRDRHSTTIHHLPTRYFGYTERKIEGGRQREGREKRGESKQRDERASRKERD